MTTDVAFAPAHGLAGGGQRPTAVAEALLNRIERLNGRLHAFAEVRPDKVRAAAEAAALARDGGAALGPLHGVPVAVKDLCDVAGSVTTFGSLTRKDRVATATATVVRRLRAAGMIVLGKTHMVEFAYGSWGTNAAMGTPWNPWDLATHRVPGGSSSGSGVAVAAGMAPLALGSDTGGSVRIPAALCGLVGLKTTVGRVSNHGVQPLSPTLDTVGPMTRTVRDTALLYDAIRGPDPADPATLVQPQGDDPLAALEAGVRGLRLGVLPDAELDGVDPEVAAAFEAALRVLEGLGAAIVPFASPVPAAELAARVGLIISAEGYAVHRGTIERDDLPFDPGARERLLGGRGVPAADYIDTLAHRRAAKRAWDAALGDLDALLTPTTPLPAIPVAEVDEGVAPMSRFTRGVNYVDGCALAIPCGFTGAGLPVSLHVVGRGFAEATVLRVGQAYERATDWHRRVPAGL